MADENLTISEHNMSAICSDVFPGTNELQAHVLFCKPQKKIHCDKVKAIMNERFNIIENSEGKFYPCSYCTKVFRSASNRSTHTRSIHQRRKPHKCDKCSRAFYRPRELSIHMRKHTGEKPYNCPHCDTSFTVTSSLRHHVRKVHSKPHAKGTSDEKNQVELGNGQSRYKCLVCNLQFTRNFDFTRHVKKIHKGSSSESADNPQQDVILTTESHNVGTIKEEHLSEHKCAICSETFPDINELEAHKPQHNRDSAETKEKQNKTCDIVYTSKGTLYPCQYCTKVFQFSSTRSTHTRRIHKNRHPHKCDTCGRSFYKPSDLIVHVRTHTGEKPYVCEQCGKAFHIRHNLSRHLRMHINPEERPEQKRFKCPICNIAYTRTANLRRHMVRVHQGDKRHECNFCGHFTSSITCLYKHVTYMHSEPELYRCRFCKKRCFNDWTLRSHLREHGEEIYICSTCSYSTSTEENLRKHEKTHVGNVEQGMKPTLSHQTNGDDEAGGKSKMGPQILASQDVETEQPLGDMAVDGDASTSAEKPSSEGVDEPQNDLIVIPAAEKVYQCELCPGSQYFTDSDGLEAHLVSCHIESEDTLDESSSYDYSGQEIRYEKSCDSEPVGQVERLGKSELIPEDSRVPANEKRYRCRRCGKIYSQIHHFENHLRDRHDECFNCEQCSYSTDRKSNLQRHVKTTHWVVARGESVVPPMFKFILHGKTLWAKALLTGNKGMRNYFCKTCGSSFNSDVELCVHYSRYHHLPLVVIHDLK